MDCIFDLSNGKRTIWISDNNCQTHLSEIKISDKHCIVPNHIYEDSLVENEPLDSVVVFKDGEILYPKSHFKAIQEARVSSYKACIWYPNIADKIPTAKSLLIALNSKDHLYNSISIHLKDYPFVRTCIMSPKDIKFPSLYDDHFEAYNDLLKSDRTRNLLEYPFCEDCQGKHLFLREKKTYIWEVRCFWSRDKLRAVSLPIYYDLQCTDHSEILEFFDKYGKELPYHSATVDIGKLDNGKLELIEINTFGPDMNATSGNFNWYEDVMILLFSESVIFR